MDGLFASLIEIEDQLRSVLPHLRDQQALAEALDYERTTVVSLLSCSLRTFAWLEDRRNAIVEAIGEYMPLQGTNPDP